MFLEFLDKHLFCVLVNDFVKLDGFRYFKDGLVISGLLDLGFLRFRCLLLFLGLA